MKLLRIYNTQTGNFIRDDFTYDHGTESAYDGDIPGGLYQPWFVRSLDGTGEWFEAATAEQIQAIRNTQAPETPSIEQRVNTHDAQINALNQTLDVIYGG